MTDAAAIILIVAPSLNPAGSKAYSTRGQLFDARVDGRRLVRRSTTPFVDAARALLAEGANPTTRFVMRHAGSASDALRSTVGAAAKLAVQDSGGPPRFKGWAPYNGINSGPVSPPMRESNRDAAEVLFTPRRIQEATTT